MDQAHVTKRMYEEDWAGHEREVRAPNVPVFAEPYHAFFGLTEVMPRHCLSVDGIKLLVQEEWCKRIRNN